MFIISMSNEGLTMEPLGTHFTREIEKLEPKWTGINVPYV
jgi:hypothetical protein